MPVYKKINIPIDNKYGFEKNNLKPARGLPPIERLDRVLRNSSLFNSDIFNDCR